MIATRARVLTLLVALLAVPFTASACRCLGGAEAGFVESDHVIYARVTAAEKLELSYRAVFETIEVLKGTAPESPLTVVGAPNFLCGLPYVSVGLDYVFFVDESQRRDGRTERVANCRSFPVENEESRANLVMLQRLAGPPVPTHPGGPQCDRLAQLDTMLAALRADFTDEHPDVIQVQRLYDTVRVSLTARHPERSLAEICPPVTE